MINKEIAKITGQPLNLSKGQITQSVAVSGPGDLGMGKFNPLKGANPQGNYMVKGCDAYGSGGSSSGGRSQR
jgi:hypothetical protein